VRRYVLAPYVWVMMTLSVSASEWSVRERYEDWRISCKSHSPRECVAVQSAYPAGRPDVVVSLVFEIQGNEVYFWYHFPLPVYAYPTEQSWHLIKVGHKSRYFRQDLRGCAGQCAMPLPIRTSELHFLGAKSETLGIPVSDPKDEGRGFFFEMRMNGFTRAEVALRKAIRGVQ
jgi:invasion protein IalB